MRLTAELMGLVRQKAALVPTAPMAALSAARIAAKMVTVLGKLGADLSVKKRERDAFDLEGGPEPVAEPRVVTAQFYDFDPNRKHSQRKRDNAQAMALLRDLTAQDPAAPITAEQKQILARYSGTGGNLVGEDGKKGSAYEYYTPKPIASGIWDLVRAMGFKGGKVGDPCAGVGIFGATAPPDAAIEAVELNETSGRVNQLVNGGPGHSVTVSPFEAVASRTPDEIWDAVITNVPFGGVHDRGSNRKIDPKYQDQPLETYFILRSLEKLKPGGLAAFIVPPRVVSAKGGREEQLRIAMSYMAEFRGAYRLPNSVFGTADADTITDVIVLRKFSRDALRKIEELREQNPALLVESRVQWTEFIGGMYFAGEGKRFILGEFVPKDSTKFRDVDRVVSDQSIPNIAKLLTKLPDSRIDWKLLAATETEPISYNEGDTITMAGQTLEMRGGVWVSLGRAPDDDRFDALGQSLTSATVAVTNKVDWTQANDYVLHLRERSMDMDLPLWLRGAHRDLIELDAGDRARYWTTLAAGLAAVEVMQQHGEEAGFNYLEEYPAVSEALQAGATTARKAPAGFSRQSKAGLQKVGIVYDRKAGFSALWRGAGAAEVAMKDRDEHAQVEAVKYATQGITIDIPTLKGIYGEQFDPLATDDWCISADGRSATKADDYYTGNLAQFLQRIDAEIAAASGAVRDKLLRQKLLASERIAKVDPGGLRFNLFSPYTTIEERAEFLRRFMHPSFVVAFDDEGNKVIIADINPKTERERQLKRFAEYLKKGNLSTRTKEEEAAKDPGLDAQRRAMLKEMTAQANAQFDQWVKSNPLIMERLNAVANDPARLYFRETEDTSPLKIDGIHPDFSLHGYQNAFVRKQARSFGGINGFDVGLGKTATALASVLYVQNIGVKKKTFFVVPNTTLSNWRKEVMVGSYAPGHPQYRPPVYASGDGCLFVGLDVDPKTGKASVDPANYARDLNRVLENKHSKVFMTLEAFKLIPLKDETVEAYDSYLMSVDPSYAGSEKAAESERADSKRSEATSGTGAKSSAIPFFEDMGVDSLVGDELHQYKNSKNTVEFSGAKFLSVAEASQRGLDIQIKAWYIRSLSALTDGVLGLTATPITNSPLEIYSMLCLAVGEQRVHDLCLGATGADAFMNVMCQIEDDDEMTIDGRIKPYRVFRGLQNVDLLRNAIATVMTIKTAADVKEGGDDLRLPEAPEWTTKVQLTARAEASLNEYKLAYRGARESMKSDGSPTEEELAALARVSEKFGEPVELIAHPFNLINKMTLLIADPELDERATFYLFGAAQAELAAQVVAAFNKLGKIEARALAGPWTTPEAVVGVKVVRDGDNEVKLARIKVQAQITKDARIVIDTMDTNLQGEFEKIADKMGLDLDCTIPPKLAALLENVRKEEANPRSQTGRVKQLIFCDVLSLHNKIKRLLVKHAGVAASAIVNVSGQTIKNAEQIQGVQDGFNAEGEENRYRYVIANEKAEVGINLQKGTQAIHHLTIGWTPDSTIQRDGRGVRQGNTTARVNRYHYFADGTFDEYKRILTTKKADWIGAVMDKQGGNDVAIAGGLTAQEYDDLINAVGDEGAMRAVRERAELKEKLARAESARARQVINFKTAQSQQAFIQQHPTVESWIAANAVAAWDLKQAIDAMAQRASSGKLNANAQIKLETRLAEMRARYAGMVRELDDSAEFSYTVSYNFNGMGAKTYKQDFESLLAHSTGAKLPSKVREELLSRFKHNSKPKADGPLAGDWASEVAAARSMADEALKDFERLAKGTEGVYPLEMVEAVRSGDAAVVDGRMFAKGMFVRDRKGQLAVLASATKIVLLTPGERVVSREVSDAISAGWTFIMFGTPEYEQACVEAAAHDDQITTTSESGRTLMFSTVVPAVAAHRKNVTTVRYLSTRYKLPAPLFPFPVNPDLPGISSSLQSIGQAQAAVVRRWDGKVIEVSALETLEDIGYPTNPGQLKANALVDYAKAHGTTFKPQDFAALLDSDYASYAYLVKDAIKSAADWPADGEARLNGAPDLDALDRELATVVAAAMPWLWLDEGEKRLPWVPHSMHYAYNTRAAALRRAAEPKPAPVAAPQAAEAPAAPAKVEFELESPSGTIGIKGETRPNKETIKAAAKFVGGRAMWRGDKELWEVPAATWPYLQQNFPRVAQVLQVVPA
ncbi:MAG: N-6 DNA methylase [Proteobacteria bacterium]|nr:N-6 DNA methylase [Pseudomonadota bacterium]